MTCDTLKIEWRHLEREEAVLRCSETGKTVYQLVEVLTRELLTRGVAVHFLETRLGPEKFNQSNMILMNGIAIEKINLDPNDPALYCGACADPTDEDRYIRMVEEGGMVHPEIPGSIVRMAALKALEA